MDPVSATSREPMGEYTHALHESLASLAYRAGASAAAFQSDMVGTWVTSVEVAAAALGAPETPDSTHHVMSDGDASLVTNIGLGGPEVCTGKRSGSSPRHPSSARALLRPAERTFLHRWCYIPVT